MRRNVFNDRIWPDFTRIPAPGKPVLRFRTLVPGRRTLVGGFHVTIEKVSHTVSAYGCIVENRSGETVAYTGDTGPTDLFWKRLNGAGIGALIVETSFPNRMNALALKSGHLTPALLARELAKIAPPPMILLMHTKPQFRAAIAKDVAALRNRSIRFLEEGEILSIGA